MSKLSILALFLVAFSIRAESQERPRRSATHPRTVALEAAAVRSAVPIRVLALMVEFLPDNDGRTSGDGTFLRSGSPNQIDPPPHDTTYFSSKLRFLENYFSKSSNGAVTVQGDLFPQTVVLTDTMAVYSPGTGGSNAPLANLMIDSWTSASALEPTFPFNTYDAFIIFHAGAGRDIDLVSLFGFDPTPNDIPSLFLNLATVREFLGDPAYQGVPVGGGSFLITNSLILPETETRVFTSGSQTDTLQLSINGLLAASFGSYLGLPDLFDTETGRSGIGQFGLMDGAAIFAFNGLFPPEPSAWEKIHLGWTTPIVVSTGTSQLNVPAVGLTQAGADTIYKIPISSTEYFLIENRSRDPERDGQTLAIAQEGQLVMRHFGQDTSGFVYYDLTGIRGSVVDVQNFDWALPGSTLDEGFEGGGILVWHVDEEGLNARIASNTVNADPDRRSVDLEEADGSQDIGQNYPFLGAGSGTEYGWPLDFWYAGNIAEVYSNAFDDGSFPNSRANSGAPSLIRLSNFSSISPRMVVSVNQGNSQMERTFRTPEFPGAGKVHVVATDSGIYYAGLGRVSALRLDGTSRTSDAAGLVDTLGSLQPVAVREGNPAWIVGTRDSSIVIRELQDTNNDGRFESVTVTTAGFNQPVSSHPVIADSAGNPFVIVGLSNGTIAKVFLSTLGTSLLSIDASPVRSLIWFSSTPGNPSGSIVSLTNNGVFRESGGARTMAGTTGVIAGVRFNGEDRIVVSDPESGGYVVLDGLLNQLPGAFVWPEAFRGQAQYPFEALVPGDLDNDGRLDIVACNGASIIAVNEAGSLLAGFPVSLPAGFSGSPLLIDIDGDARLEILAVGGDGTLNVFRNDGRRAAGFPIQLTVPQSRTSAVFRSASGLTGLVVPSGSGAVDGWEISNPFSVAPGSWRQAFGGPQHTGVVVINTAGTSPISSAFFPAERVYNWPNPVYGSSTNIRYYTSSPADISVTILTLAGESVAELTGSSPGGVDAEIPWNVSNVQSGVYLARVEAKAGGSNAVTVIKIAVVK